MSGLDWLNWAAFSVFVMWRIGMIQPEMLTIDSTMNPTPQDAMPQEVITHDNGSENTGITPDQPTKDTAASRPVIDIQR